MRKSKVMVAAALGLFAGAALRAEGYAVTVEDGNSRRLKPEPKPKRKWYTVDSPEVKRMSKGG